MLTVLAPPANPHPLRRGQAERKQEEMNNGKDVVARLVAENGCLLEGLELSLRRPDLSLRQSAAQAPARDRRREAHAPGTLGNDSRAELHLYALEPSDQEIRSRHDLRFRPRARRASSGQPHLLR